MPSIKEMKRIYEVTPIEQPILLKAIHGVGKSESVKEFFESKGYRVIPFFLGQMSDAGDVLGLPDKVEKNGIKNTDFCPPTWWPKDPNEKVVLFFDELNRAKPELLQVIMDLVLNRKLAGRSLPKSTRIIAAINPPEDEIYQVENLEPALLDRFNCYDFKPTVDEWIDWATKEKVNRHIIGFISRHNNLLDPPSSKEQRANEVYPSRRSWKRVSDIINNNSDLLKQQEILATIMLGIVGVSATSSFMKYLRETEKGIHAGILITQFHVHVEEFEEKLSRMNVQDLIALNKEIISWFKENIDLLKTGSKKEAAQLTYNLQRYLEFVPFLEVMAEFFSLMTEENRTQSWPKLIFSLNPSLGQKMISCIKGEKDNEK